MLEDGSGRSARVLISPSHSAPSGPQRGPSQVRETFALFRTGARSLFRREDIVVLALVAAIVVAAAQVVGMAGFALPEPKWFAFNVRFYLVIGLLVLIGEACFRLAIVRPASPIRYLLSPDAGRIYVRRCGAILPVLAVAVLMPAFSAVKSSIGHLNPFAWDATFIALDRAIHGTDPWRLLQPLMGHPAITSFASILYHAWFLLIYLGPLLFAFYVRDRRLRLTFFLGYVASWVVVGMVFATIFASVGPCFVGPIFGNPHFAEQMAYLHQVDGTHSLAVLDVQQQLLDWYRAENAGLGRGITAMPSMHVALCWLYVLATWQIDRRLSYVFAAFFLAIQLSSVHLAYHYAIDGYVAVGLVTAIWFLCRKAANALVPAYERPARSSGFFNLSSIFTTFRPATPHRQARFGWTTK